MKRLALAGTALVAFATWSNVAGASSDFGCEPTRSITASTYDCAGIAMLGPRNDTRINLAFLMRDRAGLSRPGNLTYPDRSWENVSYGHVFVPWGELQTALWPRAATGYSGNRSAYSGTRCQTLESGGVAFLAAVLASRSLKADEKQTLSDARALVKPACDGDTNSVAWPRLSSAAGQDYLAYLQGASAFYSNDFATAQARFSGLTKSKEPWLAETGRYMIARNALALAQSNAFSEWGDFQRDKVNNTAAQQGGAALNDYLKAFPRGLYASSATGLKRRAAWMLGDGPVLASTYSNLIEAQSPVVTQTPEFLEEIERNVLFGTGLTDKSQAPLLLATWDLYRMRGVPHSLDGSVSFDPILKITAAELAQQKPIFANNPDLYAFLQASFAYHVSQDYRQVLTLLPDDARATSFTPLAYSRQMLRGLALHKLGDRNAPGFFQQLIGGAQDIFQRPLVEFALAQAWEKNGELAKIFAPGSPIREAEIRNFLLGNVAGPDLLRRQATSKDVNASERDFALYTLLFKDLTRGRYADAVRDLALIPSTAKATGHVREDGWVSGPSGPDGEIPLAKFNRGTWQENYACPTLKATITTLAAHPDDGKGQLCLGEFYRLNGLDSAMTYPIKPKPDELGGSADQFPGKQNTRLDLYMQIMGNGSSEPDDAAYALYRAIMCYAPSGYNSCSMQDIPKAQRRSWFQRLHRDYPKSRWAAQLKYYW